MRKNRFLAIQKMAEQKKNEALHASNANINNTDNLDLGPGLPKQTVSITGICTTLGQYQQLSTETNSLIC